jgi:SAM-dependent methyltransferase
MARKLKLRTAVRSVARRVVHPGHLMHAIRLQRARKRNRAAVGDAQLALMARVVPSGYLHFGYFDDPHRRPEDISLGELMAAQHRYADLLLEHAGSPADPVLDIGCGMGGLLRELLSRGYDPTAVTPDRLQAEHVRRTYPQVAVIQSKFEAMPNPDEHAGRYGTTITSESLQYLKLDYALPLMRRLLKPGGVWVACDFFRIAEADPQSPDKAGHRWDVFRAALEQHGWRVEVERDITANVLPTLGYVHMWATQFGVPLMQFMRLKFQAKQPGLHYVLSDVLGMLDGVVDAHIPMITPEHFVLNKKYVLLVMRPI